MEELQRILVVDDEEKITGMVSDYLIAMGYEVATASNGKEAIELVRKKSPHCVILDIMMPLLDGLDATRRIRDFSEVPILLLTAKVEESDKVMGLDLGADDYLVKPFGMKELAARVRSLIRRSTIQSQAQGQEQGFYYADLFIDPEKMQIRKGTLALQLTAAQYKIATLLLSNPGRVFSRGQLLSSFQEESFVGYERSIDVHIKNIRKAVEDDPAHPRYILTVWGAGYKSAEKPE